MEESRWNRYGLMAWVQWGVDAFAETLSEERGSWTGLWAATAPLVDQSGGDEGGKKGREREGVVSGGLYKPIGKRVAGDKRCRDDGLADELWEWTVADLRRVGVEV